MPSPPSFAAPPFEQQQQHKFSKYRMLLPKSVITSNATSSRKNIVWLMLVLRDMRTEASERNSLGPLERMGIVPF